MGGEHEAATSSSVVLWMPRSCIEKALFVWTVVLVWIYTKH